MSDLSAENAGLFNYTAKSEWRRVRDREARSEGYDLFNPNALIPDDIPMPQTTDPFTLVAECKSANGRRALVVGTKTTLWRYFGVEDGLCFEAGVYDAGVYDDNPGEWLEIGSGFSPQGQRWEAEAVAGWLILNNGVDLPVSYRVQDVAVEPIYELREQGVASVGTIGKFNNILVCADIRQLLAEKHVGIMSTKASAVSVLQMGRSTSEGVLATVNSGVAGVAGNIITAESDAFNSGLGFTDMAGGTIRMMNGLERVIDTVTDSTHAVLLGTADLAEPAQPFYLPENWGGAGDFELGSTWTDMFPDVTDPSELVGLKLFWENGSVRTILEARAVDDGAGVFVDSDAAIPYGPVSLENPLAYAAYTEAAHVERYQSRVIPSMPAEPRRFAAVMPATATAGSHLLEFDYPVKSLESGQEVTITDAGENNETLRTTLLWVSPGISRIAVMVDPALPGVLEAKQAALVAEAAAQATVTDFTSALAAQQLALTAAQEASDAAPDDEDLLAAVADASGKIPALNTSLTAARAALTAATTARETADELPTTTDDSLLTRTDAVGSIVAYDDLDGDGSGILRVVELKEYLVVLKETSFFIGRYQGLAGAAFNFGDELVVPLDACLRYKNALAVVDGEYLLYAGMSDFYTFDLVTRNPQISAPFKLCSQSLFFERINTADTALTPYSNVVASGTRSLVYRNVSPSKSYQFTVDGVARFVYPAVDPDLVSPSGDVYTIRLEIESTATFTMHEMAEDGVFACENAITGEIWFVLKADADNVIRFDTESGTISTSTLPISAAATVRRPEAKVSVGNAAYWFVMGGDGNDDFIDEHTTNILLRYGLTNEPPRKSGAVTVTVDATDATKLNSSAEFFRPTDVGKSILTANKKCVAIVSYTNAQTVVVVGTTTGITAQTFTLLPGIWHRAGASYDSVLESGLEGFGKPDSEKSWSQYVPTLASQQSANTALAVTLRGALNPSEQQDFFTVAVAKPLTNNLVTLILEQHYLGDRVKVSGMNNPCELTGRTFLIGGVNSYSFNRRVT